MPKTQTTKKVLHHQKKRHGGHHHHGKHYLKTYLPYLPILLFSLGTLAFAYTHIRADKQVLSYDTNINTHSLLAETNQARLQAKRTGVTVNQSLQTAAQAKANDMVKRNYWSHVSPDGQQPWQWLQQANYSYTKAGENLAFGFGTSKEIVLGWLRSTEHRNTMVEASYSDVGFGITHSPDFNGQGPATVVVAFYGAPQTNVQSAVDNSRFAAISNGSNQHISRAELLSGSRIPWIMLAIGALSGGAMAIVLLRHGLAIRHVMGKGERFVAHHFLFDATLISFAVLCLVVSQTAGFIK